MTDFIMIDREKVLRGLKCCCAIRTNYTCRDDCPYVYEKGCMHSLMEDTFELVKEQSTIIQAYRQLLEWAVECDFGYDNIPELYEQYKNEIEIEGMSYTDRLLYLAIRSLKKGKSNYAEEGDRGRDEG